MVLQVRDGVLQVLLWQRARPPHAGRWALPGGILGREPLEQSIRRHLAAKVDVRELSHLEQLETRADPRSGRVTTAYLGLVRAGLDPSVPADTSWHPVDALPLRRRSWASSSGSPSTTPTTAFASCASRRGASAIW